MEKPESICDSRSVTQGGLTLREQSVGHTKAILGIFHTVCLAAFVITPVFRGWESGFPGSVGWVWQLSLTLANLLVALFVTSPHSGNSLSPRWRSLWAVGLFLGYALTSALVFAFNPYSCRMIPTHWSHYCSLFLWDMGLWDTLAGVGLFLVVGSAATRSNLWRTILAKWRLWVCILVILAALQLSSFVAASSILVRVSIGAAAVAGVLALCLVRRNDGSRWVDLCIVSLIWAAHMNRPLLWIPYLAMAIWGTYVAFAALGREWVLRATVVSVSSASVFAGILVVEYLHNLLISLNNGILGSGYTSFAILRDLHATGGRIPPSSACYLSALVPITLAAGLVVRRRWLRIALLAMTAIQVAGMLATGRRVGLFCIVLWILIVPVLFRIRWYRLYLAVGIGLIVSGIAVFISSPNSLGSLRDPVSDAGHMGCIRAGLLLFTEHPLTGSEPGGLLDAANWYARRHHMNLGQLFHHSHNDYVDCLFGFGIVGFCLAARAAIQLGSTVVRTKRKSASLYMRLLFAAVLAQTIVGALSHAMLYSFFFIPHWFLPTGTLLAALFGAEWSTASNDDLQGVSVQC